jgi:hypothetical protein
MRDGTFCGFVRNFEGNIAEPRTTFRYLRFFPDYLNG